MRTGAWCDLGPITPQESVSSDAALLRQRELGNVPDALVFYSRDRPTISLGHFSTEAELDQELVAASGLCVVRRVSGGRPIYSDAGQINYALALGAEALPQNPAQAFAIVCGGLLAALQDIGVLASHHAPNDIEVGGRKISGSALKRGRDAVLVHGTLLVRTDLELMGRLFRSRGGHAQRSGEQLTDLSREMRKVPTREDLTAALVGGLGQVLEIEFAPDLLLQVEQH